MAATHLAPHAVILGLALLGSPRLAAQAAEPEVETTSAGCYVISGANAAPDMTIRLTDEETPDSGRFSSLRQFEVVALPPDDWDSLGMHEVYWSSSTNRSMVMVSWLFYDLETFLHLIFSGLEPGASGEGFMSLLEPSGAGSDRTRVTVTRTDC